MSAMEAGGTHRLGHLEHSRALLARDLLAGGLAGELGGLVTGAVMMTLFPLCGAGSVLTPPRVVASFVLGESALDPMSLPAVVVGALIHLLGPSLLWGLVLGAMVFALNVRHRPGLLALSLMIAVLSEVVDVHMLLPPAYQGLHGQDLWDQNVPAFLSWLGHLAYGISLMSYAAIFNRVGRYLN